MTEKIQVAVVYATPTQQKIIPLSLNLGSTVKDAVIASDLYAQPLETIAVGIFGKQRSLDFVLQDGDRVEIYSPLLIDPKEARRERAERNNKIKRRNLNERNRAKKQRIDPRFRGDDN